MSEADRVNQWLDDVAPGALLIPGAEGAVLGVIHRCGQDPFIVYDRSRLAAVFVYRDGLTLAEAMEHVDFNIGGAWVGPQTPALLVRYLGKP